MADQIQSFLIFVMAILLAAFAYTLNKLIDAVRGQDENIKMLMEREQEESPASPADAGPAI